MKVEFDAAKRAGTLEQRGLDMARAGEVFEGATLTIEDDRMDYGETRYITIGFLDERMVVLVWTPRGDVHRIISMRKANDREKARLAAYFEATVRRGRPPLEDPKVSTTIRLSKDVIERFKASGPGWQTRIDEALRDWIKKHDAA